MNGMGSLNQYKTNTYLGTVYTYLIYIRDELRGVQVQYHLTLGVPRILCSTLLREVPSR